METNSAARGLLESNEISPKNVDPCHEQCTSKPIQFQGENERKNKKKQNQTHLQWEWWFGS